MDHDMRVSVLKQIVDETVMRLATGRMTYSEGQREVEGVRNQAKLLIPELMETYDLIYASRLRRIIEQFVEPEHIGR